MDDDQKVTTTDFVFEAASNLYLDKNRLRKLLLDVDDLPDKFGALRIKLRIDLEDRLFNLLAVKHNRTVAAHDHILLLLYTLDKRID